MPFPFARFFRACFLTITKARIWGKPFPAYSTWPFVRLPSLSHRFLLFQTEKTMIHKLKGWRNRWVSKPWLSWLRITGGVGPFIGGGWVRSFAVVATRDYIDFAALAKHISIEGTIDALKDFNSYYSDLIRGKQASPIVQLVRQLAEPKPGDLDGIDLSQYKGIKPPFDSWDNITRICEELSVALGDRLEEFER